MSLVFNATSTDQRGIVQIYEKETGRNPGDISGNTARLKSFTADVNLALDDFIAMAIRSSGTWQFDDSNQTDYPIITTNLVLGQREYNFTTDENSNLILDVYKVFVKDSSGVYYEVFPVDVQSENDTSQFTDGRNTTGMPARYDKTANGIVFDLVPSYTSTLGVKIYINREGSYFVSTDTIKKPGVPGIFHRYFALKPALDYARQKSLKNYPALLKAVREFEGDRDERMIGSIEAYFSKRSRDEKPRLKIRHESNK